MPTIFTRGAASARGFGLFGAAPVPSFGLWSWGRNSYGQLGLNNITDYSSPKQVGALKTWSNVTTSSDTPNSLAIKSDGTMWAWGQNVNGQLGLGNTTSYSSPKQVGALTNWATVSGGNAFCLAIKTDGTLWAWGSGANGKLGLGNTVNYSSPKQVGALTTWSKISAGGRSSTAIKTDGTLWSWGYNVYGQLGLNNTTNYSSPKQVGALTNWATVSSSSGPSYTSVAATKTNGTLFAWGDNTQGQLGFYTAPGPAPYYYKRVSSPQQVGALTTWATVSSGKRFTLGTTTAGALWSWGRGTYAVLGLGNTTSYSSPKQVGALTNWATVSAAAINSSFAVKTDGTLWSWGNNNVGQLGLGNITTYSSPKQVGAATGWSAVAGGGYFTLALKT